MILEQILKKNNFVHRGAQNGAQTDLPLSAITRPFLKMEPWNVNKKLLFFNIENENAKKKYFFSIWNFFYFFSKTFCGAIFFWNDLGP